MTRTVMERAQGCANALKDLEATCAVNDTPQDVLDAVSVLHDRLNKLRLAFGVDLVEPENLRSGVIAFSGGGSKVPPKGGE